uniref:G-protein coupled receptors family 3 profile domain-containing protein n=1 Tax=Ditylum brightwellii TaxID=49249 RepID=A0A7S4R276_9STRA
MMKLLRAVALLYISAVTETGAMSPNGIVSIKRSIDRDITNEDLLQEEASNCNFTGTVVLGGPFSLEQGDKFFTIGSKQLVSYNLMVDYINRFKCGINLSTGNYAIELRSYDDQSDVQWTEVIAQKLAASDVDIFLGGYSSTLTKPLAEVAHENAKLLLAPGAASTPVFDGKDKVFGTFPPTNKYLAQAVEGLAKVGAKTIATVWEDAAFTRGVCAAAPDLAETNQLELTSAQEVIKTPNITVLEMVAQKLAQEDPDVVVTCVYDCVPWMKAMRKVNWSPKAQVFTVCVGLHGFAEEMGPDAEYIMGVTPWESSLDIRDAVTGLSARDFADMFQQETSDVDVPFQAASAASVISIAVQALEGSDTTDEVALSQYIASNNFKTFYGDVGFDSNGQNNARFLLIQYDTSGIVRTVFPEETSSGPILYPMPSWDRRDCAKLSQCEVSGDTCTIEGKCACRQPDIYRPVGAGETAECIPREDMNFINTPLLGMGYFLVTAVLIFAAATLIWVYYYRKNMLVRASQPMFLTLIVFGSIISSLSIIPLGLETEYRDSNNIKKVDAACMAVPWLWGIGFAVTFSALFAKVMRVKLLYKAASKMKRRRIESKDVFSIMFIVLAIETVILLTFQFVSPLRWEREVLRDINGNAVESVGRCESESGWWFFAALVGFNILCLFYALVLCFQTKHIPSDFAESNYIFLSVMFMFQVLVLAVPVSAMVRDDTNVFYFMRACAIFLQNFTVVFIIFVPKMYRIYKKEDSRATIQSHLSRGNVHSARNYGSRTSNDTINIRDSKKGNSGEIGHRSSVAGVEDDYESNPKMKTSLNAESFNASNDNPSQPHRHDLRVSFE